MENKVYVNRIAKFLPNKPVDNDNIESFLGLVGGNHSRAKSIILRQNGIKTRYYAIDKNQQPTHSNAQLAANAVLSLFDNNFSIEQLQLLSCGTSIPDQILPSHTSMVHGLIKGRPMEIVSPSGVCASGMHAMKVAYLSILCNNTQNAVCSGSELASSVFSSKNFKGEYEHLLELEKKPIIAFEKDFLRFMLSDGAGAMLLQNKPCGSMPLQIDWLESVSYANVAETCMYMGGDKSEDGSFRGWRTYDQQQWISQSIFAVKQDIRILEKNGIPLWTKHLKEVFAKHKLNTSDIDFFLPHMSSMFFKDKLLESLKNNGIGIEENKWFYNLPNVGNVGSASIYLALEELYYSGKLKKGQHIILAVPESSRFSYATVMLTVL